MILILVNALGRSLTTISKLYDINIVVVEIILPNEVRIRFSHATCNDAGVNRTGIAIPGCVVWMGTSPHD